MKAIAALGRGISKSGLGMPKSLDPRFQALNPQATYASFIQILSTMLHVVFISMLLVVGVVLGRGQMADRLVGATGGCRGATKARSMALHEPPLHRHKRV